MLELMPVIASFIGLFLAGANATFYVVMKFNDVKHLDEAVKRIDASVVIALEKADKELKEVSENCGKSTHRVEDEVYKLGERISTIEGNCKATHRT